MAARYREIYDELRDRVLGGEWAVGERLPSIQDLQGEYRVPGLNTIRQALQLLAEDGLIESQQGRGTFVLSHQSEKRQVDVAAELRAARAAIDRALGSLGRPGRAE